MKYGSTYFLRFVIFVLGAGVLALCIFALPEMWKGGSVEFPTASHALFLIMVGMYATAVPFFIGLWQALKLLSYIDRGTTFSEQSVKALTYIKYCAASIAVLYVGGIPLLLPIAQADDAPGLILIGAGIACIPAAFAAFAAVLQKAFQSALDSKSESK